MIAGAVFALTLWNAGTAGAATYDVVACTDAAGTNNSWTPSIDAEKLETGESCGAGDTYAGLYVRDVLNVSNTPAGSSAQWSFVAPAGTVVTQLAYSRWLYKNDDDEWQPVVMVDGSPVEACSITYPAVSCEVGIQGGQAKRLPIDSGTSVSIGVLCGATAPTTCANGGTLHRAAAVLYSATVTLSDPAIPSLTNVGGALFANRYAQGTLSATFDASDNAGIRSGRIYVDGSVKTSVTYGCDFTYAVPCSNQPGAQLALDTRSLTDGHHSVQVAAVDPAGNEAKSAAQDVLADNNAPAAPLNLTVDGGSDWRSSNSFDVSWTNASDPGSPVAVAHYRLCSTDGTTCQPTQQIAATDISHVAGVSVPSEGEWALQLWLEDAAGHFDPINSSQVRLRYGVPPTTSEPTQSVTPPPAREQDSALGLTDPLAPPALAVDLSTSATPPPQSAPTRRALRLRLIRAKGSRIMRVRLAPTTGARISLTVRPRGGKAFRRTVVAKAGRFSLRLPPRFRGTVLARFAGNVAFRPARASLRVRR